MKPSLTVLLTILLVAGGNQSAANNAEADMFAGTILTNGRIYTLNPGQPWAEAVAIRNGVIIAVGDAMALESLRGAETEYIDLAGQTVLPGFHDVHVHPLYGGISEVMCSIQQGSTLQELQQIVKVCADKVGAGEWVTGGQWDAPALGRAPDRSMLDSIVPDIPVLLNDTSGHSGWANSKALEIAGLSKDTPDPEGGIIERDAAGEPTGILRELAVELVRQHVPPHSAQTIRSALEWSLNKMLSYGITSYTEASTGFVAGTANEIKAYAAIADAGILKQRVRLCLNWVPGNEQADAIITSRNLYARDRLSPNCIKIFLDGVPTDSHTAAMLEPYEGTLEGRTDEASRYGMLLVGQETLNHAVTKFDRQGLTVKFHAAGDAAVRAGLNAIAAARTANGFSSQLHEVGHCTFVAPEDMILARNIGATIELSPYLWSPSPINDSITNAIGEERIKRVWPVREVIESGALAVPGSDWSVVPSVNPWIAVESLVTREKPGGSDEHFGKGQAITLQQAFEMFTVNSAKHLGKADKLGKIEPGLLADMIVIDRNPFDTPVRELHKTVVMKTFINGELVYERPGTE